MLFKERQFVGLFQALITGALLMASSSVSAQIYVGAPRPFKGVNGLIGYKSYSGKVLLAPQFEKAYEFKGEIGRASCRERV
mgnify:CR=1 FL=1